MGKCPIIQDFAHLCVYMDDEIKPSVRCGIENPFGHIGEWKWADCVLPDRPKTPTEQRWDAMSDLQKMQLKGLLEHYSNEYIKETNGDARP